MVKHITFPCGDLVLEGTVTGSASKAAAVITHPHPLYGGDMDNIVVAAISKAYQNRGWRTLCFNFRGTGASQGRFEDGKGEQQDVDAAIAYWIREGIQDIELAGYSFGAWVLACRSQRADIHGYPLRFVAPPVGFIDFKAVGRIPNLKQIIVGTNDAFAPVNQIKSLMHSWQSTAQLCVVDNADHFFGGHLKSMQNVLEPKIPAAS